MKTPFFSIITSVFNGSKYVEQFLDSIDAQKLGSEDYELIIVDDASTDNTVGLLKARWSDARVCVQVIEHQDNKKQGGGRNTGLRHARGQWIVYIDFDDVFELDSLIKLKDELLKSDGGLDMLMVSNVNERGNEKRIADYGPNTDDVSGRDFLKKHEISWTVWNFVYKRNFLLDNNLWFVEDVLFEDADFIMDSIRKAKKIRYVDLPVVHHFEGIEQTTRVLDDPQKVEWLFYQTSRVKELAIDEAKVDKESAKVLMHHHYFKFKMNTVRYLWRLSYKQKLDILKKYPPLTPAPSAWMNFAAKHPKAFALALHSAKPTLPIARKLVLATK